MILELNNSFKHIVFTEHNHTYVDTTTGEQIISVTTLLKKLKPEFNSKFWSIYTALKRNNIKVSPRYPEHIIVEGKSFTPDEVNVLYKDLNPSVEDIKQEWAISNLVGTTLGTYLHNNLEYKFMRKNIDQPLPDFVTSLNAKDAVRYIKSREMLSELATKFYDDFIQIYTPITTEFIVGDTDLKIAGTFDLLVYNNDTNEIELWDYKTDKEIKFSSEHGNKLSVFNIDDCEYNKYSLQLSIYKYLIEKNTNLKISKCNIAHFSYRKEEFEIIPVLDLTESVKEFFENEHNKSIYFGSSSVNKTKRTRR